MLFPHLLYPPAPKWTFTPYFEGRERFNRRVNKSFTQLEKDNTSLFESRYRLGGSFTYGDRWSGRVIYQYANDMDWNSKGNFSFQASDLYVGEADYKTDLGTLKLGRQIISKGGFRLFEESFFGQRSKSFDAIRFQGKNFDLFAGKVGLNPNASDRARVAAASIDTPLGETMLVYKFDQWLNHENFYVLDQRYVTSVGKGRSKVQGEFEGAAERGRYNGLDLNSWFLHGRIGHGLAKSLGTYVEANAYSGGKNATTNFGFDPLYQDVHSFQGRMDVAGPRNLNNIEVGVNWNPSRQSDIALVFNKFWLHDPTDGFYGTSLGVNTFPGGKFIDPTGKSGRDIGNETDLLARYDFNKNMFVAMETGLFQPGNFIRAFNGSNTRNQLWGVIYFNMKF